MQQRNNNQGSNAISQDEQNLKLSLVAVAARRVSVVAIFAVLLFIFLMFWPADLIFPIAFDMALFAYFLSIVAFFLGLGAHVIIFFGKKSCGHEVAFKAVVTAMTLLLILMILSTNWLDKKRAEYGAESYTVESIRQAGKAVIQYANDDDSYLPISSRWCDLVSKYVVLHSFLSRRGSEGLNHLAFNRNLSGLRLIDIPDNVVLVFEAAGDWNLNGGEELLKKDVRSGYVYMFLADGRTIKYRISDGALAEFISEPDKFSSFKSQDKIQWKAYLGH